MTRRIIAAALLLLLALPASVLAADPTTLAPAPAQIGGAWQIVAIESGGTTLKVGGKLSIGTELFASVGCNSMSAPVTSFDGTHLVIGPLATTLIGCPADLAAAETALAAVLGAGPLTLDGTTLASSGGTLTLATVEPPAPVVVPTPDGSTVDPATCAALLGPDWNLGSGETNSGGAGGSGSSSGSGSSGVTGSGSSSSGSTGGGTVGSTPVDGGPGGVVTPPGGVAQPPGAIGSAVPVEPPAPPVDASGAPSPIEVAPATANPPIEIAPSTAVPPVTSTDAPPPPPAPDASSAPDASAVPGATTPAGPAPSGEPVPSVIAVPPMPAPTVLPGGSISQADACRMLLAALKAGTGSAIPPGVGTAGGAPVAAQDAEHASFASSGSSGTIALAVAVLAALLLGLATAVVIRRRRATRPSSGEPPSIEG